MYFLYQGIRLGIYPPLIFLCLGAMTDFAPLIARPSNAFIGIGGQLGIFSALAIAYFLSPALAAVIPGFEPFTIQEAAAIGIIGSSDGPTAIFTARTLAEPLLPVIAIAAYSYMALVPIIQPPIMKLLTTEKERVIIMPLPENVSKTKRILFPIILTVVTVLLVPAAGGLIGMLMLGNLIRECGLLDRYVRTFGDGLLNILTFLIGISIGATARGVPIIENGVTIVPSFLNPVTLIVITLGLIAFAFGTVGGVLIAKLLCWVTKGKVNPLIGNSGVSAMPMAARVSQSMGQKYNPQNHLLMHAMGPIVSSTIGSAVVAGIFIALFA